jgi:hypothetical protein
MRNLVFLLVCCVLVGCDPFGPGASDFSASLPNGYFVHRSSAHQIMVAPQSWSSSTPIIPTKVVELDHDGTWVIAKQQHLRRRSPGNPQDTYEEPDPGVFSYWILNTATPQVWGPLDQQQFAATRNELGVPGTLALQDVYNFRP